MISKEKKAEIIKTYGRTPEDTGSPEVQVGSIPTGSAFCLSGCVYAVAKLFTI